MQLSHIFNNYGVLYLLCGDITVGTEGTKMTTVLALYNVVLESHIPAVNYYSVICAQMRN